MFCHPVAGFHTLEFNIFNAHSSLARLRQQVVQPYSIILCNKKNRPPALQKQSRASRNPGRAASGLDVGCSVTTGGFYFGYNRGACTSNPVFPFQHPGKRRPFAIGPFEWCACSIPVRMYDDKSRQSIKNPRVVEADANKDDEISLLLLNTTAITRQYN